MVVKVGFLLSLPQNFCDSAGCSIKVGHKAAVDVSYAQKVREVQQCTGGFILAIASSV